jgi:[pyruvate, water dikinase]-phosphate phosphotransferase / [pyruvate, water dikinase] kinase
LKKPLVVSLHATPERLIQIRQNRLLGLGAKTDHDDSYVDHQSVVDEVTFSKRLSAKYRWPSIDVTRRSIEETAAAVIKLLSERQRARSAE